MQEAKELFRYYKGSKFFMSRDDKLELYNSYNISEEQEQLWCKEYMMELSRKIKTSVSNVELFELIDEYSYYSSLIDKKATLNKLIEFYEMSKKKTDTVTKERILQCMLKIFGWIDIEEQNIDFLKYVITELKILLKEEIVIDEENNKKSYVNLNKTNITESIQSTIEYYCKEYKI